MVEYKGFRPNSLVYGEHPCIRHQIRSTGRFIFRVNVDQALLPGLASAATSSTACGRLCVVTQPRKKITSFVDQHTANEFVQELKSTLKSECLKRGFMWNITDTTCEYGLAQTDEGCVRTLASFDPTAYWNYQIAYIVVGGTSSVASIVMYVRTTLYGGSPLQETCFRLYIYASATVLARSIDPDSYGHVIPRPISSLLSDTCTATLYTIYILALGYWVTVIEHGTAVTDNMTDLRVTKLTAIAIIWVFYIANSLCLFAFKGFTPGFLTYEELMGSAFMLAIISVALLIYGVRVLRRLKEFERLRNLQTSSVLNLMLVNHSFNIATCNDDGDEIPIFVERAPRESLSGHATKICRILIVTETVSLLVIAGQVYMAMSRAQETPVELSCANGKLCESVKSRLNLLHIFQVVCLWAGLGIFRRTQKKEALPQPPVHGEML